jgi:large subunit ribosomal protein L35
MKSHRNARFRFKVTGTGKVLRHSLGFRHILTKKSSKRKRSLRQAKLVDAGNLKSIKRMLLA